MRDSIRTAPACLLNPGATWLRAHSLLDVCRLALLLALGQPLTTASLRADAPASFGHPDKVRCATRYLMLDLEALAINTCQVLVHPVLRVCAHSRRAAAAARQHVFRIQYALRRYRCPPPAVRARAPMPLCAKLWRICSNSAPVRVAVDPLCEQYCMAADVSPPRAQGPYTMFTPQTVHSQRCEQRSLDYHCPILRL